MILPYRANTRQRSFAQRIMPERFRNLRKCDSDPSTRCQGPCGEQCCSTSYSLASIWLHPTVSDERSRLDSVSRRSAKFARRAVDGVSGLRVCQQYAWMKQPGADATGLEQAGRAAVEATRDAIRLNAG